MTRSFDWIRHSLAWAAALLLLVPHASRAAEDYATAARQHQEGRWSAAYGRFIAAGRRGDAAAAEAALFMHRFGPLLYRTQWDLSGDEAEDLARAAAFIGPAAPAAKDAPAIPSALLEAVAHYRKGDLGAAFQRFSALANQGQADAARVALFMHVRGPALYGRYWNVAPEELRRWRELAAGSAVPVPRSLGSVAARRAQ